MFAKQKKAAGDGNTLRTCWKGDSLLQTVGLNQRSDVVLQLLAHVKQLDAWLNN